MLVHTSAHLLCTAMSRAFRASSAETLRCSVRERGREEGSERGRERERETERVRENEREREREREGFSWKVDSTHLHHDNKYSSSDRECVTIAFTSQKKHIQRLKKRI